MLRRLLLEADGFDLGANVGNAPTTTVAERAPKRPLTAIAVLQTGDKRDPRSLSELRKF